jgi:peptide/nickel transport system substrate-binding protein
VKFHNGEPFGAASVKYAFERAVAKESTNKDKAVFANIERIDAPDANTVVLNLKNGNPDLLFQLGQATAIIVGAPAARQATPRSRWARGRSGWRPGARARA